jgi:hypothetical protein
MAIGTGALVALVVTGALALANNPSIINQQDGPSGAATGAVSPPSPPQPTVGEAADAFPNAAEQSLLDRLPAVLASTCVRADTDEIPEAPPRAGVLTPFLTLAAVRCRATDSVNAFFFLAVGPTAPQEAVHYHAGRRGLHDQTCEGGKAGFEQWAFGPASGSVLCGRDAYWTYDESGILGRAIGPDIETTMEWWRENARFPVDN